MMGMAHDIIRGRRTSWLALLMAGWSIAGLASPAAAAPADALTLGATASGPCTLAGVQFYDVVLTNSSPDPQTIDQVTGHLVNDFATNPVPGNGTSAAFAGVLNDDVLTIAITYHGPDNLSHSASITLTSGGCHAAPCYTDPGMCFGTTTTTTTTVVDPGAARGGSGAARVNAGPAVPSFTG